MAADRLKRECLTLKAPSVSAASSPLSNMLSGSLSLSASLSLAPSLPPSLPPSPSPSPSHLSVCLSVCLLLMRLCHPVQVMWFVLRQDTYLPRDGHRQVRLDVFSGKTLTSAIDLKVAALPFASGLSSAFRAPASCCRTPRLSRSRRRQAASRSPWRPVGASCCRRNPVRRPRCDPRTPPHTHTHTLRV
jgi:hypothetical protein